MSQGSWICKQSGKKYYRFRARELQIVYSDDSKYWKWTSLPDSRFSEVAVLKKVGWLDISGKMNSKMLSPNTNYTSYLVFKLTEEHVGLGCSTTASIKFGENGFPEIEVETSTVYISPRENVTNGRVPWTRSDGWMEIKIGTFYTGEIYNNVDIYMRLSEYKEILWKRGLIIEGIEVRPKVKAMYDSMSMSQEEKHRLKHEKVERELNSVRLQLAAGEVMITTLKTEQEEHQLKNEKVERELQSARKKQEENRFKNEEVERELNSARLQLTASQVTITTLKTEQEEVERELKSERLQLVAHQVTITTLNTKVNRLMKIIIVSLTGLVFWFLMKMWPSIWSFSILVTMLGVKMINKLVSDAFDGWVLNISIYICSYLFSKICWS